MWKGFVHNRKIAGFPSSPNNTRQECSEQGESNSAVLCRNLIFHNPANPSTFREKSCAYHPKANSSQMLAYNNILPSVILKLENATGNPCLYGFIPVVYWFNLKISCPSGREIMWFRKFAGKIRTAHTFYIFSVFILNQRGKNICKIK